MTLIWKIFLIDIPSFLTFLGSNFGGSFTGVGNDLGLTIMKKTDGVHVALSDSEKLAIQNAWDALDETAEAAKRAKPSRKILKARSDFESLVKTNIASKELSLLSIAERKFFMGAAMTSDEYDTLTVS